MTMMGRNLESHGKGNGNFYIMFPFRGKIWYIKVGIKIQNWTVGLEVYSRSIILRILVFYFYVMIL